MHSHAKRPHSTEITTTTVWCSSLRAGAAVVVTPAGGGLVVVEPVALPASLALLTPFAATELTIAALATRLRRNADEISISPRSEHQLAREPMGFEPEA